MFFKLSSHDYSKEYTKIKLINLLTVKAPMLLTTKYLVIHYQNSKSAYVFTDTCYHRNGVFSRPYPF